MHDSLLALVICVFVLAAVFLLSWIKSYVSLLIILKKKFPQYYISIGRPAFPILGGVVDYFMRPIALINYWGVLFDKNPPKFPKDAQCIKLANSFRKSMRYFLFFFVLAIPGYAYLIVANNK